MVILFISLLFNAIFLLVGAIVVRRRGGIQYLRSKLSAEIPAQPVKSPYYLHRKQQLELLEINSNSIVFLGDSITNEGEWSEWFSEHDVRNRGISSDTVAGTIDRLDAVLIPSPRQLFLMIGINDLLSGTSIETLVQSYQQLLSKIQSTAPETEVFVQSILPIHSQLLITALSNEAIATVNQKLAGISRQFSYSYIDLFAVFSDAQGQLDRQYTLDGLHLNGLAYQHWQQQITGLVNA